MGHRRSSVSDGHPPSKAIATFPLRTFETHCKGLRMTLRTKWRCHVALQPIEDVIRKGEAASGDDAQYYCISEETFENVVLGAQVQRSDGLALVFNRVKDDDIRPVEIDLFPLLKLRWAHWEFFPLPSARRWPRGTCPGGRGQPPRCWASP